MSIFFESLGWAGAFCFLFSYYMLIRGKWRSDQARYHWFNIAGGALFVANGTFHGAWAVIFINLAWGLIALYGLLLTMGRTGK